MYEYLQIFLSQWYLNLIKGERFMCYIPYCTNQQNTNKNNILSRGEIKTFLKNVYKSPQLRKLDLQGFLLKPVQRICKYPLLIREALKHIPVTSLDYMDVKRAFEKMQNIVGAINECARRLQVAETIQEVQARFSEKLNIANVNRFLIREDMVLVLFSTVKKNRKLFLFNDLLILARKDWRDKNHVIEKTPLKDIRVSDIFDKDPSSAILEIEILPNTDLDPPNRYVISTLTPADKSTWLEVYRALSKSTVRSKDIKDINLTSVSQLETGAAEDDEANSDRKSISPNKSETLERQLDRSFEEIAELRALLIQNEKAGFDDAVMIDSLNSEISKLNSQIRDLKNTHVDTHQEEINKLTEKILGLEQILSEKEVYRQKTDNVIYSLNTEITRLNSQIKDLTDTHVDTNREEIDKLTEKILGLEQILSDKEVHRQNTDTENHNYIQVLKETIIQRDCDFKNLEKELNVKLLNNERIKNSELESLKLDLLNLQDIQSSKIKTNLVEMCHHLTENTIEEDNIEVLSQITVFVLLFSCPSVGALSKNTPKH
jgi:hypothetical protein